MVGLCVAKNRKKNIPIFIEMFYYLILWKRCRRNFLPLPRFGVSRRN